MTTLRLKVFILFMITATLFGCASKTLHNVNLEKVNESKEKEFKIGVVKIFASSPVPFGEDINKKVEALKAIPIEEICETIKNTYKLEVNKTVDKTIHIVSESEGRSSLPSGVPQRTGFGISVGTGTENPYYGNLRYSNPGTLKAMMGFSSKIEKQNGPQNYINIFYGLNFPQVPIGGKITFWYYIVVESDGNEIVSHSDNVAQIPVPTKSLIIDSVTIWNEFVGNAKNINSKLQNDISNSN